MKIILVLLTIHTVFAADPVQDRDVWRIGTKYYSFQKDKTTNALLTADCLGKKKSCEAYKALLNKNKIQVSEKDRAGGKNPGAVVCKKNYGGEVLILRNSADNESAFCKFKDNSIASASDLF